MKEEKLNELESIGWIHEALDPIEEYMISWKKKWASVEVLHNGEGGWNILLYHEDNNEPIAQIGEKVTNHQTALSIAINFMKNFDPFETI